MMGMCDPVTDADNYADFQAKVERLDREREDIESAAMATVPERERATARQAMLDALRHGRMLMTVEHDGRTYDLTQMSHTDLHALLDFEAGNRFQRAAERGLAEMESRVTDPALDAVTRRELEEDIAQLKDYLYEYRVAPSTLAANLIGLYMTREQTRKLLSDLDVVIWVSRPRSRQEMAEKGATPVKERVVMELLAGSGRGMRVCASAANTSVLT